MALYKAKVEVTFKDTVYPVDATFEVTDEEAAQNGWNVENPTVELTPNPAA